VAGQPEGADVLGAKGFNDLLGDGLQVSIIRLWCLYPHATAATHVCRTSGSRRGYHKTMGIFVVHGREVMALPVADGTGTMNIQDERDFFPWLQVAWIIEKVFPAAVSLDDIARHCRFAGTVTVGAMHRWRRLAGDTKYICGRGRVGQGYQSQCGQHVI